ncbi:MAG TPA: hypothetical protein VN625_00030, partial [Desulfuromonadaceae bacterium]|nr:hypothetical protein [Desulfuromonadaceae bacterium]
VFPALASRMYGFHVEDWIYWRTNSSLYPPFEKSPIVITMANAQRATFRCPLDKSDTDRLSDPAMSDGYGAYLFSYSMTGYGPFGDSPNAGMSSLVDPSGAVSLFKESAVHNPSQKIMIAEEPGTISAKDSPDGSSVIMDGRWIPTSDPLTVRHSGKADVTFADGHVVPVTPDFGSDTNNSLPMQ